MIAAWGFTVETASDGQEALDKLTTFPANVIVTDLMMPRMDGFELMKRLASDGNMPPSHSSDSIWKYRDRDSDHTRSWRVLVSGKADSARSAACVTGTRGITEPVS